MTRQSVSRATTRWAPLLSVVVVAIAVGLIFFGPVVREIYCDGSFPVWMLEAQGYTGGGCAEVLPSSEAPPNADWRQYCVGMCNPADYPANSDYSFGP